MSDDQKELAKWLREFDYNLDFFSKSRTADVLRLLSYVIHGRKEDLRDVNECLLAYREHAQELLAAIFALEKIVG